MVCVSCSVCIRRLVDTFEQVESTGDSENAQNLTITLRRASVIIFLVVACILVVLTARLAFEEESRMQSSPYNFEQLTHDRVDDTSLEDAAIGKQYRLVLLLAIALLCVTREAFFVATSKDPKKVSLHVALDCLPSSITSQ